MPPEVIPIETLVERALAYAKDQAPGPGVANWIGATAYTKGHIEYLGDGRFVIGHLYEMGAAKRHTGDTERYPIVYNPDTQQLQVKLPRNCMRPRVKE